TARPPTAAPGTVAPPATASTVAVAAAPGAPPAGSTSPAAPAAGSTTTSGATPPAPAGPSITRTALADADRPIATANGFKMQADSLDALLPGQQLQTVIAVGRAHGESWDTAKVDSARTRRPATGLVRPARDSGRVVRPGGRQAPDSATVAAAIARVPLDRDVVDADTIVGHFVQVDTAHARPAGAPRPAPRPTGTVRPGAPAIADTARPEPKTELDRMQAFGSAHALYRLRQKPDSTKRDTAAVGRPGINYVIGDTIDLKMAAGEVSTAHVRGLERGVYLDPSQPSATDSTSTGAAAGSGTPGVVVRPPRTPAATGGTVPATAPPRTGSPPSTPPPAKTPARPEDER
ncbi:MAG: hypothetical protein JWM27_1341, partial [Gemmatimonadetes bacterium]|nr:hypothetical protein [Gemmatimonadota bacterium]